MFIAEIIRTAFIGVCLFLAVATTCGLVAATVRLYLGKNLPDEDDRRLHVMEPVEGTDPLDGMTRRAVRAPGLPPIQPQNFKKAAKF